MQEEDIIEGRDEVERKPLYKEGMVQWVLWKGGMMQEDIINGWVGWCSREAIIEGRDDAESEHYRREGWCRKRTLYKGGMMH